MPFIDIVQPDDRRWNSFTMCLESILKIRPALEALLEDNDPHLAPLIPSGSQLDALQELLHPLKLIKTTSDTLLADTRPTMHLVLSSLINIGNMSKSRQFKQSGTTTRTFVEAFEQALESRLPNSGREVMDYNLANFLHPTFKGSLLNYNKDYQSYDKTCLYIRAQFPEKVEPVRQEDMFAIPSDRDGQGIDESGWGALDLAREEVACSKPGPAYPVAQTRIDLELELWRDTAPATSDVDIDILGFWKAQEDMLPCLAKLARMVLAIPVTTSSLERTLVNSDKAEELIFIHENYDRVSPLIKHWKLDTSDFETNSAIHSDIVVKEEVPSPFENDRIV